MTEIATSPFAKSIREAPHQLLANTLHRQDCGTPRPYANATLLADVVAAGRIAIDDLIVPWRPSLDVGTIDMLLAEDGDCFESDAHRLLKVHARIVALAMDPDALLEPEAAATDERHPLRADLLAWNAYGVSQSFECGVTDGRGVLAQLLHGQLRVIVLPFAGLALPQLRGYVFRLGENPELPPISATEAERAWQELRASVPDHALCPPMPM